MMTSQQRLKFRQGTIVKCKVDDGPVAKGSLGRVRWALLNDGVWSLEVDWICTTVAGEDEVEVVLP